METGLQSGDWSTEFSSSVPVSSSGPLEDVVFVLLLEICGCEHRSFSQQTFNQTGLTKQNLRTLSNSVTAILPFE